MRDFYPDVFDGLGFLPREYGAMQVFVEPVERGQLGQGVARVWLQAAFEPVPAESTLAVFLGDSPGGFELARHPLPATDAGAVVRWRLPLRLGAETERLCFAFTAQIAAGAERVRANRTQNAASRGPALSELGLSTRSGGGRGLGGAMVQSAALTAVALPFGYAVVALPGDELAEQEHVSSPIGLPVEDMPRGFLARVVAGAPDAFDAPVAEVVWAPGRPLPQREDFVLASGGAKVAPVERVCFSCGQRTQSAVVVSCPLCGSLL